MRPRPGAIVMVGGAGARNLGDDALPPGVRIFTGLDAFRQRAPDSLSA